jgi:thiamine kinase-like enzyme
MFIEKGGFFMEKQEKTVKLKKFFESLGYENVQEDDLSNFHFIFFAEKNGKKCFIKRYNVGSGSEAKNIARANNELLCYRHLPTDLLIEVVEINPNEKYLVLERVQLQDIEKNAQYVEECVELVLSRFPQIDSSFLLESSWEDYEKLFGKFRKLEEVGIIDRAVEVIEMFEKRRGLIEGARKVFSHQDFNRRNVKKVDGRLKIFDFEIAKRDNAMVDLATMYFDIWQDEVLLALLKEKAIQSELYNEELMFLMVLRRTAIVMNAYRHKMKNGKCDGFLQGNLDTFLDVRSKF